VFEEDFRQNQLWVVDASDAEGRQAPVKALQITRDASLNVNGFAWSPDGKRIAFRATHNPMLAFGGDEGHLSCGISERECYSQDCWVGRAGWRSDFFSRWEANRIWTALAQPYFYYANGHIGLVDVERSTCATSDKARDVQDLTGNNFDGKILGFLDWGPGWDLFRRAAKDFDASVSCGSEIEGNHAASARQISIISTMCPFTKGFQDAGNRGAG